ncbi:MAG: hypothetical protein HQ523_06145 [Lentisphaerae bacterium]|nr:hypothetical protein [Lentisphaerota bacterium]
MPIVVDTHVHLYPGYDLAEGLPAVAARLRSLAPGAVPAVCLTERTGQHVFQALAEGRVSVGTSMEMTLVEGGSGSAVCLRDEVGPFYILPGRQMVTAERLEILALGRDLALADGARAESMIQTILKTEAIPVLTWAFGKWWFGRSHQVRALVARFAPEELWLGDTTMRPREWPRGTIMRGAIANGRRVLAGSDPLPSPAEFALAGRYATLLNGALNPNDPVASILQGFRGLPPGGRTVGGRCWLLAVLMRLRRYRAPTGR